MPVKQVSSGNLKRELEQAEDRLVLIDFFANWCGPCRGIAPKIDSLSEKYSNAVFLKIDVDSCEQEVSQYSITAMPTFVFIRNSKELERVRGADPSAVEETLKKHYKAAMAAFSGQGHSMLSGAESSDVGKIDESEISRLGKLAQERWGTSVDGQTITTIRLRLPDQTMPVNLRLSSDRTLYDVRRLLAETISSLQTVTFEFLQPPATKISFEDEEKTINELKLLNAVLNVRKVL